MSYVTKDLAQLVNRGEPAWPLVQEWIDLAVRPVEVLPPAKHAGEALVSVQVTTRSPMGAIILETGGLLIDHGWLRILGSGHPRLPRSLPDWNFACGMSVSEVPPPWVLIADDVVGGFFALDGGRFGGQRHTVWYYAPDSLEWEDLKQGYSEFLCWCFSGKLDAFYEEWRWPGWEEEVSRLEGDRAFSIYPPLSADGPGIDQRSRSPVPLREVFLMNVGAV
jgi:uncharacterized protein DUF2625